MKEIFFVFRHFGFGAGIVFIFSFIVRGFKRLLNKVSRRKFPIRFEDLTRENAEMTLWAAGVSDWPDDCSREELNKIWNDFISNEMIH